MKKNIGQTTTGLPCTIFISIEDLMFFDMFLFATKGGQGEIIILLL